MLKKSLILLYFTLLLNGCIIIIPGPGLSGLSKEKPVQQNNAVVEKKSESAILEIGKIASVNSGIREVVVNQKKPVKMGDLVYVMLKDRKIFMTVSFPMQTVFKCTVAAGDKKYLKEIKKDMTVFMEK